MQRSGTVVNGVTFSQKFQALLRPGRFDRHISIDMPTVSERKEMFDLYLKKIKLDQSYDKFSKRLSQMTPGFTGSFFTDIFEDFR